MITLRGDNEAFLSVRLDTILSLIDNIDKCIWKLIWIEGVSQEIDVFELEKKVNESDDGLLVDTDGLSNISLLFNDLTELVLLGDKNEENLHKLENDDEMKARCEYFIELVDSSYWEITSQNQYFIKKLETISGIDGYNNIN